MTDETEGVLRRVRSVAGESGLEEAVARVGFMADGADADELRPARALDQLVRI